MEVRFARLELRYERDARILPKTKKAIATALYDWGLSKGPQEVGWVVAVDGQNRVHTIIEIARGTARRLPIHMPTLLGAVLASGTDRFVFVHSHPGARKMEASDVDITLTQQIADAAAACGLYFEDHWIVTNDPMSLFSFEEHGMYEPPQYIETEASRYGT